jgi:hypothetical protein
MREIRMWPFDPVQGIYWPGRLFRESFDLGTTTSYSALCPSRTGTLFVLAVCVGLKAYAVEAEPAE